MKTIPSIDGPAAEAPPRDVQAIYSPIESEMAGFEAELGRVILDAPPFLREELTHVLRGGGKRLRPALVLLSGRLYPGRSTAPLLSMALGYELLHTATLVHDDTIDNAVTRRGRLTVNRLWGNSHAIMLGDYLCGCSAMMTAGTGSLQAMEIFSRALADLCGGAAAERVAGTSQRLEGYFSTISRKTASLFAAATESGALLSRAPAKAVTNMKAYGYNLGMAFQTLDDICDYRSDMSQGGMTLPAILLLQKPGNRPVAELLDRDPPAALDALAEMVAESGVLEECRQMALDFCGQARTSLHGLPPGRVRDSLDGLVGYIMEQKA
jgi:geranylgeranyl pyrophosphate synthase